MAILRFLLNFIVLGALLGVLVTSWVYPRYAAWNNSDSTGNSMCVCSAKARQTAEELISAQMQACAVGAGIGAALGVAVLWMRRGKNKPQPPTPEAPKPA